MKTVTVEFDSERGRLKVRGRLYAGSKVALAIPEEAGANAELALYHFDLRLTEDPPPGMRVKLFPPAGLKCVAKSTKENGETVLDLNTVEIRDIFSDPDRRPGARIPFAAYLWDGSVPAVLASGFLTVDWSPVYFTPEGTAVSGGCKCGLTYRAGEETLVITSGRAPGGGND